MNLIGFATRKAREFLKEVLTPDPLTRPSASKLLEHRWVAMNGRRSSSRSNGIQEDYPDNKHGGETPIPSGNNDDTGKRNQGTAAIGGSRDAAAADPSSSAAGTCQENNGRNENEGCSTAGCADGGGENGKGPTQGHRASHSSSASSRHVRQYSRSTGDIFGGGARNDGSHHHHRSSSKRGSRVVPINNLSHRRRLMTMLGSYPMKRATFGASRLEIRNAHSLQRRIVGIAKPSPRNGGRASLQGSGTAHVNGSEEWRTLESSDDEARPLSFGEKYELKNLQLGMGSSSIAMLCRNKETRSDHAVCILDRARVECSRQAMLRFRKLKSLEHDQLLKTADTFITPERLLIVSEMCWGGDLFEHMVRHRQVAEPEARNIIKAVLSAVAYLHTNGVVHGNVTPEKILLSSPNDVSSLRLDPFSMSAHITLHDPRNDIGDEKKQQHRMATTTTPLSSPPLPAPQAAHAATSPSHWYMAPELSSSRKGQHKAHREEEKEKAGGNEVGPSSQQQSEKEHKGNEGKGNGKTTTTTKSGSNTATSTTTTTTLNTYGSEKADMWSVGVLAYTLIAGVPPFTVSSSTPPSSSQFPFWVHIPDMVQDGSRQLDFGGKAWEHVSSEAIAFVRTALQFEPEKRFEASEALKHPWMTTVLSIPSVNEKSEGAAGNDIKLNDGNASEDTSSVRDMRRGSVLTSKRHSLAVEPGSPTGSVHSSTSNQSSLSRPKKREMMRWKMVQRARWRRRQRLPTSVWKTLMNPVESSRDDAAPLPKSAAKWLQHMQEVGGRMSSSPTSKPQVGSSSRDGVTGNRPDNGVSAAAPLSPSAAPSSSRPDSRRSRAIYSHTRKRSKSRSLVSEMRLWTEEEVGEWVARRGASKKWAGYADVCFSEGFDGVSLLHAKKESLIKMGIRHHHADAIIGERDVYLSTSSSSVLHAAAGGGHTKGRAVPSSSRVNTHHQHSASPHHQNQLLSQSQLQEQGDQKAVPPYHPFSRDSRDGGGNQHTSSLARGSPSISPLSKAHSPHHQGVSSSSRNASSRSKSPRHDRHNREGSGGGSGSVPLLVALLWKRQKLGWGTRVFKLTSSALKYYRPAANERYAKAELLGTFELGYISRVYAEEDSNLIFRIDIASAGGKRLRLRAATPLQREDWIRTLNDARSKVARKKPKVGKFWKAQPTVVMVTPPADNDEDTV